MAKKGTKKEDPIDTTDVGKDMDLSNVKRNTTRSGRSLGGSSSSETAPTVLKRSVSAPTSSKKQTKAIVEEVNFDHDDDSSAKKKETKVKAAAASSSSSGSLQTKKYTAKEMEQIQRENRLVLIKLAIFSILMFLVPLSLYFGFVDYGGDWFGVARIDRPSYGGVLALLGMFAVMATYSIMAYYEK